MIQLGERLWLQIFSKEIAAFVFWIVQALVDPEDEGSKVLGNFVNYAPADTAQYPADLNLYEHQCGNTKFIVFLVYL